uniref:Uncharacterized protein n=1 Tax=Strombidium rassoulzadegani TaxID=1082188 RepID=A0A7S3CKP1_9SPIT|mmetsp:Transcript_13913/g.23680  ORF Transcript_13913/g.23680 Transcript_13913/m.23680 type:complete len:153 (+) Transcript_13913:212-670(+)
MWGPGICFIAAYICPDAQDSATNSVTSQLMNHLGIEHFNSDKALWQQKLKAVHRYRESFQLKTYGGLVYQALLIALFKLFPKFICMRMSATAYPQSGYGSSDLCEFFVDLSDLCLVIIASVSLVFNMINLHFIVNYEHEFELAGIRERHHQI